MNRPAATHATHDELLLARLYGGDVEDRERTLALDQMASCEECAGVFADFGAIAAVTEVLPVPPRPRDFTLSEAQAARLRRRSIGWRAVFEWFGRTKALGGSMVAAGVLGVVLVGAISALTPAPASHRQASNDAAAPISAASAQGPAYVAPSPAPDQSNHKSNLGDTTTDITGASTSPQPSGAFAATSPEPGSSAATPGIATVSTPAAQATDSSEALGPDVGGKGALPPGGSPSSLPATGPGVETAAAAGGPDASEVALGAFAGLAILGLLLLVIPRLAARRSPR